MPNGLPFDYLQTGTLEFPLLQHHLAPRTVSFASCQCYSPGQGKARTFAWDKTLSRLQLQIAYLYTAALQDRIDRGSS